MQPWGSGRVFQNFADPELEDWAHAYYCPNYQRLLRVRASTTLRTSSVLNSRYPFADHRFWECPYTAARPVQRRSLLIASATPTPQSPGSTAGSGGFTPNTAAGGDLRLVLGCRESTASHLNPHGCLLGGELRPCRCNAAPSPWPRPAAPLLSIEPAVVRSYLTGPHRRPGKREEQVHGFDQVTISVFLDGVVRGLVARTRTQLYEVHGSA